jgi:2-dehydropantoate 2-reductase
MQNGLGNEEDLAALFGAQRVMGAMAFVCNTRVGPGIIRHASEGWVRLGEFEGPSESRTHQLCRMFQESGVECKVIDNLLHGRWEKIFWNIPFNGLGAIMDLSTDRLLATPQGTELVTALMKEAMSVAARLDLVFPEDFIEKKLEMTRRMGVFKTSMQVDREEGRPLETQAIVGRPLRVAQELVMHVPLMVMVYRLLKLLEFGKG